MNGRANTWSETTDLTQKSKPQAEYCRFPLLFFLKWNCVFSETSICKKKNTFCCSLLAYEGVCVCESWAVPFSPTSCYLNTDFSARFSLLLLTTTRPDLAQCPPCAVIIPDLANIPGVCNQPWALFVCRVLQSCLLSVGLAAQTTLSVWLRNYLGGGGDYNVLYLTAAAEVVLTYHLPLLFLCVFIFKSQRESQGRSVAMSTLLRCISSSSVILLQRGVCQKIPGRRHFRTFPVLWDQKASRGRKCPALLKSLNLLQYFSQPGSACLVWFGFPLCLSWGMRVYQFTQGHASSGQRSGKLHRSWTVCCRFLEKFPK